MLSELMIMNNSYKSVFVENISSLQKKVFLISFFPGISKGRKKCSIFILDHLNCYIC